MIPFDSISIENQNYKYRYLPWAEANNLIILFPLTKTDLLKNPQGCFDWWGYSSKDYAFKSAPQMVTFANMAQSLATNGHSFGFF